MTEKATTLGQALAEIEELRARLEEAEAGIRAIQSGEVDAVVVSGPEGERIYTLTGAEHMYRILVEAMNEGALVLSPEGTILFSNRAFAGLLGTAIYDILGHSIYDFIAANDVTDLRRMLAQAPALTARTEIHLKRPADDPVPTFISVANLETDEGPSISAVVTDLTEHKRTEAELAVYREHLEELVVERTRELARANEQLAESQRQVVLTLESVRRQTAISRAINRIVKEALTDKSERELAGTCLSVAKELTESPFGFICEIDADGSYRDIAGSSPETPHCPAIDPSTGRVRLPSDLRIHGVHGRAMLQGHGFFTNQPPGLSHGVYSQERYPRLTAFLGMPLLHAGNIIGILGLGNRAGGYRDEDLEALEALAPAFVETLMRKRAEKELARARTESERWAAQLESSVSSMVDGILVFDADGHAVIMNEPFKRLVGAPPDAAFDEWVLRSELNTLEGAPVPRDEWPSVRALRGEETRDTRYRLVTTWNRSVVSISGAPVRDSRGKVIGGTLSFRDASERVELEREREEVLKREHHIASVLQQALVPPDVPKRIGNLTIAVRYRPALSEANIGGDFFDVFELDDDRVGVLIGDVTGKGLQAAIRVAAARYSIRSYAFMDPRPAFAMTQANRTLCRDAGEGANFLTAFFLVIDRRSGAITYSGAGHEPPIVCRASGGLEELEQGGIPLGIVDDDVYTETNIRLEPGDAIVMVTDGVTEARARGIGLFEKSGLLDYLQHNTAAAPEELASGIMDAATAHAGGQLQDDAAVVVVRLESSVPAPRQ